MAKSLDIIDPKKDIPDRSEEDSDLDSDFKDKKDNGGIFYLVLGIIAILVATAAALYILFQRDQNNNDDPNLSTINTTVQTSAETSQTAVVSPEATSSIDTTPEPAFTYTDETLRVANGNRINGEASRIKKILESKGYKIASIGNASKNYSQSIIYFKTGQDKLAEALKEDLKEEYLFEVEQADQIVGSYDAVIVLGSK
jgi:hypothetical protein